MVTPRAQSKCEKVIYARKLPDFISDLPPEIIEEIFKYLSIKDLARTSILSKQWRYKWTMIPCLVFDENCVGKPAHRSILTKKFARVITNILLKHQGDIHMFKFNLRYPIGRIARNLPDYINRWVDILNQKGIKNLSIELGNVCAFEPKEPFFCCEKLEALKLKTCSFHTPASFNTFTHLKELHLEEVTTTDTEFYQFTSQCPLLEKLTLINATMEPIRVSIPSLKYLHVQGLFSALLLENLGSVTYLLIHLSLLFRHVGFSRPANTSTLECVLASLCSLEKLELWSHSVEFLANARIPVRLPFMLNHLEEMFLGMNVNNFNEISVALCLLRSSPRLKTLCIGGWWRPGNCRVCENLFWNEQDNIDIPFNHLEFMILEDYCDTDCEIEFINYVVTHSPALKKINITIRRPVTDEVYEKFAEKLLELARDKELVLVRTKKAIYFDIGLSKEMGISPFLC